VYFLNNAGCGPKLGRWIESQGEKLVLKGLALSHSFIDVRHARESLRKKFFPMAEQLQRRSKPRPFKTGSWVKFFRSVEA
jgi:hypothetical protein